MICRTTEATIIEVPDNQNSIFTKSDGDYTINYTPYYPKDLALGLIYYNKVAFMYKTLMFADKLQNSVSVYIDLIVHVLL